MKINYHLLLVCFWGCLLVGCNSESSSEATKNEQSSVTKEAIETERTAMPTTAAETTMEAIDEKTLVQRQEEKILLAQQLYELYNAADPPKIYYVEDLVIKTYLESMVESAEVEFMDWENGLMLAHADFFNGEPVGGKRFLVQEDALFCVEIIELKTRITESGESTDEVTTYTFYYDKGQLIQVWDGDDVATIDPTLERLSKEHLEHWELIKANKRH